MRPPHPHADIVARSQYWQRVVRTSPRTAIRDYADQFDVTPKSAQSLISRLRDAHGVEMFPRLLTHGKYDPTLLSRWWLAGDTCSTIAQRIARLYDDDVADTTVGRIISDMRHAHGETMFPRRDKSHRKPTTTVNVVRDDAPRKRLTTWSAVKRRLRKG